MRATNTTFPTAGIVGPALLRIAVHREQADAFVVPQRVLGEPHEGGDLGDAERGVHPVGGHRRPDLVRGRHRCRVGDEALDGELQELRGAHSAEQSG